MTSTIISPPKTPDPRSRDPQYQSFKTSQCSKRGRKYDHRIHEYRYCEWHERTPYYDPELPPYQPGRMQYHLDPLEVKRCLEQCDFEYTKYHKPPCRPQGRYPVIKKCKPQYTHKPTFSEIFGKLKSDYDQVKPMFECQINESLHVWPYCTVGKIWVGANHNHVSPLWTGTGVLVGCDLMLTASHIVPWNRDGWWMRFIPAFSEGSQPFGSSYVMDVCDYSISGIANDFAVCKLSKPLGEYCGWMSVDGCSKDHYYTGSLWNMAGYLDLFKDGEVQFFDGDEEVKKVRDDGPFKLLKTHTDPWGWCGGVLWGWQGDCPSVIGVLSGEDEELCIFINAGWAGGPGMMDLVRWASTSWE